MANEKPNYSNKVGQKVLILTPTFFYMGEVVGQDAYHYHLRKSAWIEDVGRHHEVFRDGKPHERTRIEPHADDDIISVMRMNSTVLPWRFPLWRDPK